MLSQKLLRCSKCKSENIISYQIIQTKKQLIIWYRCNDCGRKDRMFLDISEKKYLMQGLSNIFFKCYRCGSPVIIQELRKGDKASVLRYQCLNKNRVGIKKISTVLYHDLRTLYLSKENKSIKNIVIAYNEVGKITCSNCGHKVDKKSNFCSYCRANLKEIKVKSSVCPSCKASIRETANFCTSCGQPLGKVNIITESENNFEVPPDDPFENYIECHFCGANVPDNKICPACGANLHCDCGTIYKSGSKFCHGCGKPVSIPIDDEQEEVNHLKCPECKASVPIGYSFCTNCGHNMEKLISEGNEKEKEAN